MQGDEMMRGAEIMRGALLAFTFVGCALEAMPDEESDKVVLEEEDIGSTSQAAVNTGGNLPGECFGGIDCLSQQHGSNGTGNEGGGGGGGTVSRCEGRSDDRCRRECIRCFEDCRSTQKQCDDKCNGDFDSCRAP
jgi:hypothetical protein